MVNQQGSKQFVIYRDGLEYSKLDKVRKYLSTDKDIDNFINTMHLGRKEQSKEVNLSVGNVKKVRNIIQTEYSKLPPPKGFKEIPLENAVSEYLISEDGTIINKDRRHILNTHVNKKGYEVSNVSYYKGDYKVKSVPVHRLVALTYIPNKDNKEQVNHIDGNKLNNNVTNLEWVTNSENIKHANETGLMDKAVKKISGSKNYQAKLLDCEVQAIRDLREENNTSVTTLSKIFGVSRSGIKRIINYKSYKPDDYDYKA